uniref:Uncharacterized protein n=1 Tax=viral metagenome TaxID=1070528 RepID=A0A6C0EAI3_9ZZZZ
MRECYPDEVRNPYTLACLKKTSKRARALVLNGDIPDYGIDTYRQPRGQGNEYQRKPCRPDQFRNPETGRCKKLTRIKPKAGRIPQFRSEGRLESPVPDVSPLVDARSWVHVNCRNRRDPLTGRTLDSGSKNSIVKLHERTCAYDEPLSRAVAAQHAKGRLANIPGTNTEMTREDFRALRDSMRRRNPAYKIPPLRREAPPESWVLYIEREGQYLSVKIIDMDTRAMELNLGYIPIVGHGRCSVGTVVDMLRSLDSANRLIAPKDNHWQPVVGPFNKSYWKSADALSKYNRMCLDLANALSGI